MNFLIFLKHFHPFGVALTENEKEDDFRFVMKAFKDSIGNCSVKFVIADLACAISNAVKKEFETSKRIDCFFHVML